LLINTITRTTLLLSLLLLCITPSWGQAGTTTVTAQVKDSNGTLYVNCQWSVIFVGENTTPGVGPYAPASYLNGQQGKCDSQGNFSVNLGDNINTITPTPSQWSFSICSAPGYPQGPFCKTDVLITVTGATQDITATLTPLMPILPTSGGGGTTVFPGVPTGSCISTQTGVNSSNGDYYSCSGGVWVKVGPGGGGAGNPGGGAFQLQTNVAGTAFGGIGNSAAGSVLASQGTSAFPAFQTKPIVDARDYSGTDWCAQVNAADTAFSGVQAIINAPSALSGLAACTTSINITSGHVLNFGKGTFALGTQNARAGIVIAPGANNVSITGAGMGQTILTYTSVNNGAGNGFLNGSAIGMGRVVGCTSDATVSHNIMISSLSIVDLNTGSALGSGPSPSGIDGACVSHVIIENNELTDIKGNGAITITGQWNGFGGDTYYDRNNIFDGTVTGGGGEFTADNSANWTHYYVLNNTVSRWPCAFGVSRAVEGLIVGNTVDATLKAPYSACPQIGLGAGSDTAGTLGNLFAINNVVVMGFSGVGIGIFPSSTIDNTLQMGIIGNNILSGAGSSETGLSINGTGAGHIAPTMIVQNNTIATDLGTSVSAVLKSVEFSGNTFTALTGSVPLFDCNGSPSIAAGGLVRVFNNRASGPLTGGVAKHCTDASFSTRRFQEWNNTLNDGNPNSYAVASGFLGQPTTVTWTPGTIAPYSSTGNQTATVTQAIAGDSVTIVNANGSTNWLSLPAGVIASGSVTSANTVTFNITNTTAAAVTINSGSAIQSYVIVDRPPNNAQTPYNSLNGTIAVATGTFTNLNTSANCAATGSAANPSLVSCAAASAGAFSCDVAASAGTCVVSTTAVTANSQIFVQLVSDEGTRLGVTCNTSPTTVAAILVAAKVAATSFTINMPTIAANPACFDYWVVN
jgi:hypothetical protein